MIVANTARGSIRLSTGMLFREIANIINAKCHYLKLYIFIYHYTKFHNNHYTLRYLTIIITTLMRLLHKVIFTISLKTNLAFYKIFILWTLAHDTAPMRTRLLINSQQQLPVTNHTHQ